MKTNTKKQSLDAILSLYCKIESSIRKGDSNYTLEDVKKELAVIISKF